jgi:tetratricopeptide (TPR) repeat protein
MVDSDIRGTNNEIILMKIYISRILPLLAFVVVLVSCGSTKKAVSITDAKQLSEEEQRRYDYYYLEAVRQTGEGNYTAAYNLLEHCLAINPKAPSALYDISQYYQYLGRYADAQQALETAVTGAKDNYWYAQALVSYYQRNDKKDEAMSLLEEMTQRFPERQDVLYALASTYGEYGEDKKMAATLDRLESIVGKSEQLTMEKVNAYVRSGDNGKALAEVQSLVDEYPLDNRYKVLLGGMYEQNDNPAKAYEIYSGVLADEPDNAMALMSLLNYYQRNDRTDEYEKQIDAVLRSETISAEDKYNLLLNRVSYIENSKQDSTVAIALFEKAIADDNCDASILQLYAQYLWQKNMQSASRPVLERALSVDPENNMARLMLLQLAVQGEDYTLVKSVCETGIDVASDELEYYLYLAIAYNEENRTDEAMTVIEKAVGHINDNTTTTLASDIYSIRGDLLHAKNKNDEAYKSYDKALEYTPDNVGVLNNYAYYLSVDNKNLDKAEEMSYKTIKSEPNNATYLDTYAWILFVKGRYTEARTYIEQALKDIGNDKGVIKEHAGDIFYMDGDVEKALDYWTQALNDGNDSKTLKEKIKRKKYIAE